MEVNFGLRVFQDKASSVLPYLQILEALDSKLDLTRFCESVPVGAFTVIPHYSIHNAMILAELLMHYGEGDEVSSEQVSACPDPFFQMVVPDSPSQVLR